MYVCVFLASNLETIAARLPIPINIFTRTDPILTKWFLLCFFSIIIFVVVVASEVAAVNRIQSVK